MTDTGHDNYEVVQTRKSIITIAAIAIISLLISTVAFASSSNAKPSEAAEQTILRLLFTPAYNAIKEYYGEPRQYWKDKLISVRKVPNEQYYEVIMQAETFTGPHNPPYGIETMTFYISYGSVELRDYKHIDDPAYLGS